MSVCPSVRSCISKTVHTIFLIFCMKVYTHRTILSFKGNFLKNFGSACSGPNVPKMAKNWVFRNFLGNASIDFSDFLHEVGDHSGP